MEYPDTTSGPRSVDFGGRRYWRKAGTTGTDYYFDGNHGPERTSLHRAISALIHGPIPEGFDVHHLDGNRLNNAPENLKQLSRQDHMRLHLAERFQDPEYRKQNADQLTAAQEKAKEWHGSEEGKAWHKENAERMWTQDARNSRAFLKPCEICGETFSAFHVDARFCSTRCFQRLASKDGRYVTLGKTCPICATEFMTSRHNPKITCSRSCAGVFRWRNRA